MSDANSLDRLHARLTAGRTRLVAHVAAAGMLRFVAVGALAVLALALAGIALAGVAEAPLVLAALAVGALATAFGLCVARPLALAPGLKAYALLAEERFPEARSLLVNALELAPAASGPGDLRHAVVVEAARRADGLSLVALAPTALPRNTARLLGLAVALWALGLGFFGGPLGGSVDRLLHPGAAAATLVKIAVEPGDITLPPGATLHVRATVTGTTQHPTLHFARPGGEDHVGMDRAPDDAPAAAAPGMAPARTFDGAVRNVATNGTYWVEALGVRSPLYVVTLKGEPGIVSFDLTYEYPAYTRLSAETRASTTGDVSALTGTRVTVVVNLDRDAKDVSWRLPGQGPAALAPLSPRRWRGQMTVGAAGPYTVAVTTDKAHIEQAYRIAPVADQPPLLTVIQPEGDLDLPAGQKIALWATGTDDYGLTRLSLVAQNEAGKVLRTTLAQWPDQPRDASVGVDWDASDLALLPGQSATFHLELADNDAVRGPNVTVSRTFTLRFPLLSEIYKSLESDHDSTRADLQQAQRETKELQKQVDDLQKGLQNDRQVSWEKQQAAKSAAAKQQELSDRVAKAAQSLDQQAEKAQEHKAYDEQLLSKMQELSKLVAQIKSEDLRRAMGELSKKVDQVDPRQLQSELKDLEQQQKEMLQNLDRTLALMEKLRDEEKTHEAAARAQEMAQQQKRLNDELANKPPTDAPKANALAQKQDDLQAKAKELSEDLKKLAQEMEQRDAKSDETKPDAAKSPDDATPKPNQPMKQGAQALDQDITPNMEKSASDMRQSPSSEVAKSGAKQSGKQAQQGLENLSQSLGKAAADMSNDQDEAVAEAIKRSAQDLLNLSQAGEQAMNSPGPSQQKAEAAQDLSQGANQVVQDLLGTGKDTPYLGPEATQELGRAINQLERAKDAYANGDESQGKSAGQSAGEAIDKAVISLRNSASACKTPGPKNGGKNGGGSKPKMQGLADQQSDLNSDTQSLAERLTKQQRIAAGDQASLEKLAARQQMIRQGIEEAMNDAKPGEQPLGRMDQAKDDADQVAQDLKRGRLDDDTLTRQQKILSRMLDATRSIHRRDYEEQRESNHGVDMPRPSPTDLRADLLKRADRVQGDLLRAQAEKYPGEYRSLVESYLRRLGATE
jgi:hypothetical protein